MRRWAAIWTMVLTVGPAAPVASTQSIIVHDRIGAPTRVWLGGFHFYAPMSPYARPLHGPSLYRDYGDARLQGRILALPAGVPPPASPQALERYTVGRVYSSARTAPSGATGGVAASRAPYYPRESYIRTNPRRTYRRGG